MPHPSAASSFSLALCFTGAVLLAGAPPGAAAADDPPPSAPAKAHPLDKARELIANRRWPAAIEELRRLDARGDADWNNLMGFALRKQASPDLAGAEAHYDEALRLSPRHRGALEYSGELYLMKGEGARAEARLAALEQACGNCAEYQDLKRAIHRYKAAGNRHLPGAY